MEEAQTPCGVLPVDKPAGVTSHDVVGMVRRLYHTRSVGHTGTLDPMATGVLTVLVGRAVKAAEYLVGERKTYEATLCLGITTDTEDTTGKLLTQGAPLPPADKVIATAERFIGPYAQVPPMVSALKVGGKKLADLARKGIEIERKPRDVTIFSLSCEPAKAQNLYRLRVECSSGTYIRTLCADIGKALGCGGAMASLRRVAAGGFSVENCHTPEMLERMDEAGRLAALLPVEFFFSELFTVRLPAFFEKLARSGCEIYQAKIKTELPVGTRVRLADAKGHFFGLGEVRDYPAGSAIRTLKLFEL